jgi:aspartyl-tRNA(Asn)/glutamyl-tRNA(Gln) amidotransferase subunit A
VPLSTSLDSVGPLAPSVACCATLDAVLAGAGAETGLDPMPLDGLRLAVPQTFVLDGLDRTVARAFEAALARLSAAGARISDIPLAELAELPAINAKGGFAAAEAYAWHRRLLDEKQDFYDPRVSVRILRGRAQSAADYIELRQARADLTARIAPLTAPFDAVAMPTAPVVAPTFAELEPDEAYARTNALVLRNPAVANFLDRCAVSLPCHEPGEAPVGFMLMGERGADRRLLAGAAAVEPVLSRHGG